MICFGDSITQGYTSKFSSLSYVNQVARALNAEVVNQGIGGYYFNEATIDPFFPTSRILLRLPTAPMTIPVMKPLKNMRKPAENTLESWQNYSPTRKLWESCPFTDMIRIIGFGSYTAAIAWMMPGRF